MIVGIQFLNLIQPCARKMEPVRLAERFAGRISFHCGIAFTICSLPHVCRVPTAVANVGSVLDANDGYILPLGRIHIQADTPVANPLAMCSRQETSWAESA